VIGWLRTEEVKLEKGKREVLVILLPRRMASYGMGEDAVGCCRNTMKDVAQLLSTCVWSKYAIVKVEGYVEEYSLGYANIPGN
jgi:hypothetical protein